MTMEYLPGDDWARVVDGAETLVWTRPESGFTRTMTRCLRRRRRSVAMRMPDDRHARHDVVWLIPTEEAIEPPRIGDCLADGQGRRWTVLRVSESPPLRAWRCEARDVARYGALYDYVDIERASFDTTASGQEEAYWQPWRTGVPARWGRLATERRRQRGEDSAHATAVVFLLEHAMPDAVCRIRRHDGAMFRVLKFRRADTPGEPSEVEVEPWRATSPPVVGAAQT